MFKKLISNLPFSPSLIDQVSFYTKRMHAEASIRRIGFIFVTLAFFVQLFAFLAPPHPSLAASGNDIIPGGFDSKQSAVNWCNTNAEIRGIYSYFGVSCPAISNSHVQTLSTTAYNKQLYSLGRYPYGKAGETPVQINGQTFYMRYLWSWGEYNFKALAGTRSNGTPFLIMFDCGNIVIVGAPTPPPQPPPPPPQPPPPSDACPNKPGIQTSSSACDVCPNVAGIQLNSSECDVCPMTPGTQNSTSQCDLCPNISGIQTTAGQCDVCPNIPGTQSAVTQCDVCPNITGIQTSQSQCDVCPNVAGTQSSTSQCDVCPLVPGTQSSSTECKPCEKASHDNDTSACLVLSKTAQNDTQGISNAGGTTARAGDVITYRLQTKNTGSVAVKNFVVHESIGDVLEYADATDFHGGTFDPKTKIVSWPGTTINPGGTLTQHLTIRIKSPVPQSPILASNPGTGDMTMTNVYGNTIEIKLPPNIIKTTEQLTITSLPNTGPGSSLIVTFGVTSVVAYFFARSRLMARELDLVKADYANTGSA